MACNGADAVFGPRVSTACRTFDFTLYFEDIFFVCVPAAAVLLLCPVELWLLRNESRRVQRSALLGCKLVSCPCKCLLINVLLTVS
jgi:hypothetical protein